VALLLVRVEMFGYGEARGKDVLEAQQLAAGLLGGFEEGYPFPGDGVLDDVSGLSHGVLLRALMPSPMTKCAASQIPVHPQ
jgi:hypothetical protein